jgi:hypothetical protein
MSETSDITGPLLKMLNQAGHMAMRMPVGKVQKGKHWIQMHEEGTADILCFPRSGGVVWIETKAADGKTHKERAIKQAQFREDVLARGHRHILAKSIDEGLQAVNHTEENEHG